MTSCCMRKTIITLSKYVIMVTMVFFFKDLFVRESTSAGGAEGEGDRISSRLHGAPSHNPENMT